MSDSRIPYEPSQNGPAYQIGSDSSGRRQVLEQEGAAFWAIPGINSTPQGSGNLGNIPTLGDFTQHQAKTFAFGQEVIPTLLPGQPENEHDQTVYSRDSQIARIVDSNRNSIVEIQGPAKDPTVKNDLGASGFFIDDHGDIATTYHIVRDTTRLQVNTADGVTHEAHVVASNPSADLAIISIGAGQRTQPAILDSVDGDLRPGDSLTVVGHPHGWQAQYVSPGTYLGSGTLESLTPPQYFNGVNPKQQMLVANMNTQFGNSGSPVFNGQGQVIGLLDRGNGSHTSYVIPTASLTALMNGKSGSVAADTQIGQSVAGQSITTKPLSSNDTSERDHGLYVGTVFGLGSRFLSNDYKFKGYAARIGTTLSGVIGLEDFVGSDRKAFVDAFSGGSSDDKFHSTIGVASDGLLVGGAVAGFIPYFRAASVGLSLSGTALKIGNRYM